MEDKEKITSQLMKYFQSFDVHTASKFIADVLYYWGLSRFQRDIGSIKEPAESFFFLIGRLEFDVNNPPDKSISNVGREDVYSESQIAKLIDQLESVNFGDAIDTFVSAAYQWLTSSDLSSFGKEDDSLLDIRLKVYREWGAYLGVD